MLEKIEASETVPKIKNITEVPGFPSIIDYVLMTDGQCFVSSQFAKKLGGHQND